jgi:hypothetical protein
VARRASPSNTIISRRSPVNGSRANVCSPSTSDFVTPNVLRFGRGAPSLVRVPGDDPPTADVGVDPDPAAVDAAATVEPEPADGLASTGPD